MSYQTRLASATMLITDFLRQYQRPTHLDDEGCMREIAAIAEEVNGLISASSSPENFRDRIETAFRHIRKTYTQRAWPMPAHFIKALDATAKREAVEITGKPFASEDAIQIVARRIAAGDSVGDGWLYGRGAVQLLREGLVTTDQIRKYRSALYFAAKEVGGQEYAQRIEDALKEKHNSAATLENA